VVVSVLGNTEPDRYLIQKSRIGKVYAQFSEIIPDGEHQLIGSKVERIAFEQRLINPTIRIRDRRFQKDTVRQSRQSERNTRGRVTMGRIKDVCCEFHAAIMPQDDQ